MNYFLILTVFISSISFSQNNLQQDPDDLAIDYSSVDIKPEFPGGMKDFYTYIMKNFTPPDKENLKGKVIINFIIERDGTMTNMKIKDHVGFGSGEEALRVLREMSKWKPGEHSGKIVRTSYFVKINIEPSR